MTGGDALWQTGGFDLVANCWAHKASGDSIELERSRLFSRRTKEATTLLNWSHFISIIAELIAYPNRSAQCWKGKNPKRKLMHMVLSSFFSRAFPFRSIYSQSEQINQYRVHIQVCAWRKSVPQVEYRSPCLDIIQFIQLSKPPNEQKLPSLIAITPTLHLPHIQWMT